MRLFVYLTASHIRKLQQVTEPVDPDFGTLDTPYFHALFNTMIILLWCFGNGRCLGTKTPIFETKM